jgi:hypothetical protein
MLINKAVYRFKTLPFTIGNGGFCNELMSSQTREVQTILILHTQNSEYGL